MKAFKYILAACLFLLIAHVAMTVVTERASLSRWAMTEKGQAYVKNLVNKEYDAYSGGGEAANSALVFCFGQGQLPSTTEAYRSDVYFDYEGSGRAVQTGWIGPEAGLLLARPFLRGEQPDGRFLFGNHNLLAAATYPKASEEARGFAALKTFDGNHDGQIDAQDFIWPSLRIWRDHNHNGLLDFGELYSLDELGIASLSLDAEKKALFLPDHNYLAASAYFTYVDGRQGLLDEIYFQRMNSNYIYSRLAEPEEDVPDLKGGGLMPGLRIAAAKDPKLKKLTADFIAAESHDGRANLIDDLLAAWAAAGGLESDLAARAGSSYRLADNCLDNLTEQQKKYLPLLDAWAGRYSYRLPHEKFPGQQDDPKVIASGPDALDLYVTCPKNLWDQSFPRAYMELKTDIYFQLVKLGALRSHLETLGVSNGQSAAGLGALSESFNHYFEEKPREAAFDLMELRIVLARDRVPSRLIPGLDKYIADKLWNVVLDEEMRSMQKYMLKSARTADEIDHVKRLKHQWGQDSIGQ